MTFSYIDRLQADQFSFIRIPKALLTENTFAALSSQAKILYGIMVDKMDDSMKEYTSDIIRNLTEMWSDADATLRQSMKTDLTRLVQQMN